MVLIAQTSTHKSVFQLFRVVASGNDNFPVIKKSSDKSPVALSVCFLTEPVDEVL